jgi:hypothetical protein
MVKLLELMERTSNIRTLPKRKGNCLSTMDTAVLERLESSRPETPEPGSRQGRRNGQLGVQLLDDEGLISEEVQFLE